MEFCVVPGKKNSQKQSSEEIHGRHLILPSRSKDGASCSSAGAKTAPYAPQQKRRRSPMPPSGALYLQARATRPNLIKSLPSPAGDLLNVADDMIYDDEALMDSWWKKTKKLCPAAVLVRELYSALVSQFSQSKPYLYRSRHL